MRNLAEEALERFEAFRSDEGRRLAENWPCAMQFILGLLDGWRNRTAAACGPASGLDKLEELRTTVDPDRLEQGSSCSTWRSSISPRKR